MRIIHAALKDVPLHTSRVACERLLRPLYPFGQRAYWPYKAWRRAVRRYLADRARWAAWVGWREQSLDTPLFHPAQGVSRETASPEACEPQHA